MRNIPVSLEEDAVKTLDDFAEKNGVPRAQVMRKALDLGFPVLFKDPSLLEHENAPTKGRKTRELSKFEQEELNKLLVLVDPVASSRMRDELLQEVIADVVEATDRKHNHVIESHWDSDNPNTAVFKFRPVEENRLGARCSVRAVEGVLRVNGYSIRPRESLDMGQYRLNNIKFDSTTMSLIVTSEGLRYPKTCLDRELPKLSITPSEFLLANISDVLFEALKRMYPWARGKEAPEG